MKRILSTSRRGRVVFTNSNTSETKGVLPLSWSPPTSVDFSPEIQLTEVEDRRTWNPEVTSPARSISKTRHRLKVVNRQPSKNADKFANLRNVSQTKAVVAFRTPAKVAICIRRKIRKEVLFATGKGGRVGQKRPRRNAYSSISCR